MQGQESSFIKSGISEVALTVQAPGHQSVAPVRVSILGNRFKTGTLLIIVCLLLIRPYKMYA